MPEILIFFFYCKRFLMNKSKIKSLQTKTLALAEEIRIFTC